MQGSFARRVAAILIVGVLVSVATGGADAAPDAPSSEGRWFGYGVAAGTVAGGNDEVIVEWDGSLLFRLQFDADASGSLTRGAWEMDGDAAQDVATILFAATGDLTYAASGQVTGSVTELRLDGSARTQGSVDLEGDVPGPAAGLFPFKVDNENAIPTLTLRPVRVCDELVGGLLYPIANAFADAGLDTAGGAVPGISARFVAIREGEGVSERAIAEFEDLFVELDVPIDEASPIDAIDSLQSLMLVASEQYFDLMDSYPAWSGDQVYATVDLMRTINYELRNLSDCQREFIGEGEVESFIDFFTGAAQDLTGYLLTATYLPTPQGFAPIQPDTPIDPVSYRLLTEVAADAGAIGAGAVDTEAAFALETALIDIGSGMLTALGGVGDGSVPNADATRVLTTGAIMGWTYTVDGEEIDARRALAELAGR